MEETTITTEAPSKMLSRRFLLKGSMSLTAAVVAAPAMLIGAAKTAAPVVEQVVLEAETWFEEVGGI